MRKVLVVIGLCAIVALGLSVVGAQAPRGLPAIMQDIQTTNGSLTAAVTGNNAAQIGTDAAKMQTLFTEAEAFFTKASTKALPLEDAAKMAKEIAASAGDIAKSKDGSKVKTGIGRCKECHAIHKGAQDPVTKAWAIKE